MHPRFIFHPALWALNLLLWAICLTWLELDQRLSLSGEGLEPLLLTCGIFGIISLYIWRARRNQNPGENAFEWPLTLAAGSAFMLTAFLAIRLLNHLTMSVPAPLADDALQHLDELLGADWYGYATWIGQYPALQPVIRFPYSTTTTGAYFVFLALALSGHLERAVEFGSLLFLAALFTVIVAGFFPAEAAMVRHMDKVLLAMFHGDAGVYHLEALRALRGSGPVQFTILRLPGLATFPSFHTIAGVLMVYACRGVWYTLAPATLWTAVMLLATPVYGGHYFVDILAGLAVAAIIIAANVVYRPFGKTSAFPRQRNTAVHDPALKHADKPQDAETALRTLQPR